MTETSNSPAPAPSRAHIPELEYEAGSGQATDAFGHVQLAKRGIGDALARTVENQTGFETRS